MELSANAVAREVAGSLPAATLAEVSAIVAILATRGVPAEATRPWEILIAFLPWYSGATGVAMQDLWQLPARAVIGGICKELPAIAGNAERVELVNAELVRLIELLEKGLG